MTAAAPSFEVVFHNDYLLLEILIRLPAKSLIRFKSVNKSWRSLISAASFRRLHAGRRRTPQTSFLLRSFTSRWFHFDPSSKNLVPFNLNLNFDHFKIRQSCNGLLLLEIGFGYPNEVYYVYNPTTGESRNLFLPNNENADFRCLFLAYDPLKSPHYKAICLRDSKTDFLDYFIDVYDSETHEWKRDDKPYQMPPHTYSPDRSWVYSNNFTYSLSHEGGLFCFDTEKLMFGDPLIEDFGSGTLITESFGHVDVVSWDNYYLVVHEITEKNDEWSSEHLFHFDIKKAAVTPNKISCVGGVIRGEKEEISLLFHIPAKIMAYHFHERRTEELLDLSTKRFYEDACLQFGYRNSYQFVESLAPV